MSSSDAKRPNTNDDAPFELVYWPGIPGRGEVVRLLFEEAGVPYTDHAKNPNEVVTSILDYISPGNIGDATNPPVLAPPVLKHGELVLHQLPNILLYLAPKIGLAPKQGDSVFFLNQIVLTLLDGFVNELHDTHHPISTSAYYEDQKPEAKKRSKAFIEERIPKFLGYSQRVLDSKSSGEGPWLHGGELTYADLVLFQCIDGTKYAFPKSMDKLQSSGKYDGVFKLYETVKERPNISKYLASERRVAYAQGIWRHYPELEEGINL